jgi:ABC-2 type transport system ATP-binding protein
MPEEVLRLESVGKRYGDRRALDGVSFTLHRGEAVGYLGPNGAGKTTTLRLLSGLARPTSGTVRVAGLDPAGDPVHALARLGVLVEGPGLLPYVHGRDLLDYVAEVKGIPRAERQAAVARASERLGVADQLDRPVGGLSTGLSRRLLLASALLGEPDLLLLDEPTLGLDPIARADLRALLCELRKDGPTLLLSTHLLEDVSAVCDRVLFLRDGQLRGDEPVRAAPGGAGGRTLRLRFASPVDAARLEAVLPPGARVKELRGTEATVIGPGSDPAQAELLHRLVTAGLPVVALGAAGSDLERRYLELVGREEST